MSTQFKCFYDGECPLCRREIGTLKKSIPKKNIAWLDINEGHLPTGKTKEDAMQLLHLEASDDHHHQIIGIEANYTLWELAGFKRLIHILRSPYIKPILNCGYLLFARYRHKLTPSRKVNL